MTYIKEEEEEKEGECDSLDVRILILPLSLLHLFSIYSIIYLIHQTCTRELSVGIGVGIGYSIV